MDKRLEAGAVQEADVDPDAVDAWLRGAVAEAYDAVETGAAELMTIEEVRASLGRI